MASVFDELFEKKLDRKEFLAHMGAAGLALIGVSGLIKSLTDPHGHKNISQSSGGYGGSPYGR